MFSSIQIFYCFLWSCKTTIYCFISFEMNQKPGRVQKLSAASNVNFLLLSVYTHFFRISDVCWSGSHLSLWAHPGHESLRGPLRDQRLNTMIRSLGSLPVVALLTGFINQMLVGIWNYFFVIITFLLQMIIFMIFKRCTRNQFGNASSQHIQSWAHWTLTNVLLKKLLVFVAGLMPHWLSHWRTVLHTFKSKDSIFKML